MEKLYPPLPSVFMSKSKSLPQLLPNNVNERLVYLWNTANDMIFSMNALDLSGLTLSRRYKVIKVLYSSFRIVSTIKTLIQTF